MASSRDATPAWALVRDRILAGLRGSGPPDDPAAAALARIPAAIAAALFPEALIPAAVLVPLLDGPRGIHVLLTQRTEHLRDHPGQISFPGGRIEATDAGPLAAALREAAEEIGLREEFVDVAGYLAPHAVVTGFAVSPVVGFLRPGFELKPDRFEVAEIFEVPLDFLLDPRNLRVGERTVRGISVASYAYDYGPRHIWGATAQMLRSLCKVIDES